MSSPGFPKRKISETILDFSPPMLALMGFHNVLRGSCCRRKSRLSGLHGKEQSERMGLEGHEPKSFVEAFGRLILGIHEQSDSTGRLEDRPELLQRGTHEDLPQSLSLQCPRHSQTTQQDPVDLIRQLPRLLRRQLPGFHLTECEREESEDGFRFGGIPLDQHEGSGDAPLRMLSSGLLEEPVERLAATVEALPIVRLGKRFEPMRGPGA